MTSYFWHSAVEAAKKARTEYRSGLVMPTAGVAPNMTQANMISLPYDWAYDFLLYAQRNPKACPLLDVSEPGEYTTILAKDADLRTDFPLYRIWRHGQLVEEVSDATLAWQAYPDMVTFLIGCSFSFETALREANIDVRHITQGRNVPMYRTNIACRPAGRLHGEMVVSMRPIPANQVAQAALISGRFPSVHGAPVHVGKPELIGIKDIMQPDFGDAVDILPNEIPVFWACGVTPQAAIMASKVPFAITHAPGHMFITDVPDANYHV